MQPTEQMLNDAPPPYESRRCVASLEAFDPLALPWREMRKNPRDFPDRDVAKVSRARTVVGLTFVDRNGAPQRIYVKRSLLRGAFRQLAARFRDSKELREFELAGAFLRAGFTVPEPLYYSEAPMKSESARAIFYATRALPERWKVAKEFFKGSRTFAAEWESLAMFTRLLHERGVLHSDYRSDHLFMDRDCIAAGEPPTRCWALIDLDGSRCGRAVSRGERDRAMRQLAESLITSGLVEEDLKRFLEIYDREGKWGLDAAAILKAAKGRMKK
ncbi:MAG TPA: lipopolysaccharide kinase InaA family protein [Candidatus Sumerlaeota bacterium]|nr:lipopolysaccharide kinase InaA family protein [Candidatus Sumerlaeota bacterium]